MNHAKNEDEEGGCKAVQSHRYGQAEEGEGVQEAHPDKEVPEDEEEPQESGHNGAIQREDDEEDLTLFIRIR